MIDKQGDIFKVHTVKGISGNILGVAAHIGGLVKYNGCSLDNQRAFTRRTLYARVCVCFFMVFYLAFFKLVCVRFVSGYIV